MATVHPSKLECQSCGKSGTLEQHCAHSNLCDLVRCKRCGAFGKMTINADGSFTTLRWRDAVSKV